MKKIFLALMALAACTVGYAKTADELRIYINPGHGSWTGNDRPMPLVNHGEWDRYNTDTCGFFESNTNLRKGFGVLEMLREYGLKYDPTLNQEGERWQIGAARDLSNNIVMSHVKCGPFHEDNASAGVLGDDAPEDIAYYNRSLLEVATEVESNNFDMFISIHSNAAVEGTNTNYCVFMRRGHDDQRVVDGITAEYQTTSIAMATACWPYAVANEHMMWTSNKDPKSPHIRGDIEFMGGTGSKNDLGYYGYLSVLKHSVPGFLVEGYFHTYQPDRHRAMNFDACYLEGVAYAHGIADYWGLTKESTGDILGVVRDLHEKFTDTYYKPNVTTLDRFKPLNGVTAILWSGDTEVARYTTDENYNGEFIFRHLEPGDYTITFEAEGYKPIAEPVAVTVKAATICYPTAQLESESYIPPKDVYYDYPDALQLGSVLPSDDYVFAEALAPTAVDALAGKTIRRTIVRNDRAYILALDADNAPTIVVVNVADGSVLTEVSTSGMKGTTYNNDYAAKLLDCSDIALTADGVLIATPLSAVDFQQTHPLTIYKWANDAEGLPTGDPELWFTCACSGNYNNSYSGETICYTGTVEEGTLYYSSYTTAATTNFRVSIAPVIEGTCNTFAYYKFKLAPGVTATANDLGANFRLYTSPFNANAFLLTGAGESFTVNEYIVKDSSTEYEADATLPTGLIPNASTGMNFFKYAGATYMAVPEAGGYTLLNVTNGLANAKVVDASTVAFGEDIPAYVAGETRLVYDSEMAVTDGYINLSAVTADGSVEMQSTREATQPVHRAEYAYDLSVTEDNDNYMLHFKVSGDVVNANVVLTPVESSEQDEIVLPIGPMVKGEQMAIQVSKLSLGQQTYTWSVTVESAAIGRSSLLFDENASFAKSSTRGGVVTITDPESPMMGYTVVAYSYGQGFSLFDRDYNLVENRLHAGAPFNTGNKHSAWRGGELRGKAVFADWSDAASGYWMLDPANFTDAPVNMLQGERNSDGGFVYDGTVIGGGSTCAAFAGEGDNTVMYTFEEDITSIGSNVLVRYRIGESDQITALPETDFGKQYSGSRRLQNTSVEVCATTDGAFVSQYRAPGGNTKDTPAFIYIDNDGNELYNSGESLDEAMSCSSGIALNRERTLLAVGGRTENIRIFAVEWTDNTPSLTYLYSVPNSVAPIMGQIKFDIAGNLHTFTEDRGYRVYSLPTLTPTCTTAAPSSATLVGQSDSQVTIELTAPDTDAIYYNLQGIQVDPSNITPGVYLQVKGNTAVKVRF
ncbi:MAG: prealbumin-like fold domain-containing protein [Muribaculaceae bacterium]